MRHRINRRKLNRTSSHRKAMLKNMANSLVINEQIITTLPKAKTLRPYVEKLITIGKKNNLAAKRLILAKQQDLEVMQKICNILAVRYKERNGGYIRILKAGFRYGDCAPKAVIEFVERDINAKGIKNKKLDNDNTDIHPEKEKTDLAKKEISNKKKSETKEDKPKKPTSNKTTTEKKNNKNKSE